MRFYVILLALVFSSSNVYSQYYQPRIDLLDKSELYDVFCIGDMLFVVRDLDVGFIDAIGPNRLESVPRLAEIIRRAEPKEETRNLINELLEHPQSLDFVSAKVFDEGDSGFRWDVVWNVYPELGGTGGLPFEYHANLLQNGKVLEHELILCDHLILDVSQPEKTIISNLQLSDLDDSTNTDKSNAISLAKVSLANALKQRGIERSFDCVDAKIRELPSYIDGHHTMKRTRPVWEIQFLPLSSTGELNKTANGIKMWVGSGKTISNISVGEWALK